MFVVTSMVIAAVLFTAMAAGNNAFAQKSSLGLLAAWSFEEGEGDIAQDVSGNRNDGKIIGAQRIKGPFGSALRFFGEERVEIPDSPSFALSAPITVEFWYYPEALNRWIISKGDSKEGVVWRLEEWRLVVECLRDGVWISSLHGTSSELHQWHQAVLTLEDGKISLFIDGLHQASRRDVADTLCRSGENLIMGAGGFRGALDEIRIYNRALSLDEIKSRYKSMKERYSEPLISIVAYADDPVVKVGKADQVRIRLHNKHKSDVQGAWHYRVADSEKQVLAEGKIECLAIPAGGNKPVSIPMEAKVRGYHNLICWWNDDETNGQVELPLFAVDFRPRPKPERHPKLKLKLLKEFDCTQEYGPDEYYEFGKTKVVDSPIGKYREAAEEPHSRFAYRFFVEKVLTPHLLVIEYPDDKRRAIMTLDGRRAELESGIYTGDPHPNTNKMQKFKLIYWPAEKEQAIIAGAGGCKQDMGLRD